MKNTPELPLVAPSVKDSIKRDFDCFYDFISKYSLYIVYGTSAWCTSSFTTHTACSTGSFTDLNDYGMLRKNRVPKERKKMEENLPWNTMMIVDQREPICGRRRPLLQAMSSIEIKLWSWTWFHSIETGLLLAIFLSKCIFLWKKKNFQHCVV